MDIRNPVQSLTWAVSCALERDLNGVESVTATQLLALPAGRPVQVRPKLCDCSVILFTQCWTLDALGYPAGASPSREVQAETSIVTGPCGDACVYVGTQLLYHVQRPNRRFFLDVASQHMRGPAQAAGYDGRDAADEEAFAQKVVQRLQAWVEQANAAGTLPTTH